MDLDDPIVSDDTDFHSSPNKLDKEHWPNSLQSACVFDNLLLSQIHHGLAKIIILSWVDHPPTNLGNKTHGKLKADHWLILFTIFFSLILPEIWSTTPSQKNLTLLKNLHNVVACTYVIISHMTSTSAGQQFSEHFFQYCCSSQLLFPNIKSCPDYHYAMYIPDFLCFWGLLIKLNEYPYEHHNGLLQHIQTNKHLCEFFYQ